MKQKVIPLALAAVMTVGTAHAQSSVSSVGVSATVAHDEANHAQEKPKADKRRLFKAGGIGCLTGALGGLFSRDKKAIIAGCAIGGAVGTVASYRAQMQEARELASQAEAAGMKTTVASKQVKAKSGEQVEALDQVVIAYDPASMTARDPKTVAVLDKIAALAKKSKEPLTIAAEGKNAKACQIPLAELQARDAFPPAKAVDRCGQGKAQIVITPVPDLT